MGLGLFILGAGIFVIIMTFYVASLIFFVICILGFILCFFGPYLQKIGIKDREGNIQKYDIGPWVITIMLISIFLMMFPLFYFDGDLPGAIVMGLGGIIGFIILALEVKFRAYKQMVLSVLFAGISLTISPFFIYLFLNDSSVLLSPFVMVYVIIVLFTAMGIIFSYRYYKENIS